MLSALLSWVYIAAVTAGMGAVSQAVLQRLLGRSVPGGLPLPALCLLGLAGLSVLVSILSFFSKVGAIAHLVAWAVIAAVGLTPANAFGPRLRAAADRLRSVSPLVLLIGLVGLVIAAVLSARPPENGDVALYHAQTVQWTERFPVVPGLGNLHFRLAFNSTWALLSAFCSLSWLASQPLRPLNGFLLLVALSWCLRNVERLRRGSRDWGDVLGALLIVPSLHFSQDHLSQPTNDIPVALLLWLTVVAFLGIDPARHGGDVADLRRALVVILCVFAVTIKLSALPLLVLAAWVMSRVRSRRARIGLSLAAAAVLVPWMARTAMLSGYLFFPLPGLPALPVDWAVSRDVVEIEVDYIRSWALQPRQPASAVLTLSLTDWLPAWWARQPPEIRWLLAIGLAGMLGAITVLAARWRTVVLRLPAHEPVAVAHVVAAAGLGFWFSTAPDARFGLGWVVLTPALLTALVLRHVCGGTGLRRAALAVSLGCLGYASALCWSVLMGSSAPDREARSHWWLPPRYPTVETRTVRMDELTIRSPVLDDRCWNEPVPCTPYATHRLELRGGGLGAGFRMASSDRGVADRLRLFRVPTAHLAVEPASPRLGDTVRVGVTAQNPAGQPEAEVFLAIVPRRGRTAMFLTPAGIGEPLLLADVSSARPARSMPPGSVIDDPGFAVVTLPDRIRPGPYVVYLALIARRAASVGAGDVRAMDRRLLTVRPR